MSAAIDVLRDALRRMPGTVRCAPEDGALVAYFDGGKDAFPTRLGAVGTRLDSGRTALVAGARFELYSAYPIRVPVVPASIAATG
jgi:hypothetical protein